MFFTVRACFGSANSLENVFVFFFDDTLQQAERYVIIRKILLHHITFYNKNDYENSGRQCENKCSHPRFVSVRTWHKLVI